jgi:hypothetical protein
MQFGKANERLWQKLGCAHPKFGRCYMYKIDISDCFYRVLLSNSGVQKLGVCLPDFPGLPRLAPFPLVLLPMGWMDSPPCFVVSQKPPGTWQMMRYEQMHATQHIHSKDGPVWATVAQIPTEARTHSQHARQRLHTSVDSKQSPWPTWMCL